MRYARVEDNKIIEYRDLVDGEIPPHKIHLWKVVEDIVPSYNSFYQTLFGPEVVIEDDKVKFVYIIEDKDPAELRHLVKAEAENRILSKYPIWKQNNMLVDKLILTTKIRTEEEDLQLLDIDAAFAFISDIRAKSNALESLLTIPEDYTNDIYWT